MASAIYPIRHEAHWGEHKVYMRKYTNQSNHLPNQFSCNNSKPNPSPSPNLNPNPNYNPSINRFLNQTPNTNNPNPSRFIHDSSSEARVWQNDEPSLRYSALPLAASSSCTVDLTKEFSQGGHVTFHLGSYSRRELKELRNRFISELERVRICRYQIETCEYSNIRSNHCVQPPMLQPNTSNAATSVAPPTVKEKKNAGTPRGGNNKGHKRAMPFSSGRGNKRPANAVVFNSPAAQKVATAMMRRCGQILAKLMKHKHGWVFNKPVDTVGLVLHNYHEIIRHPMDLGTVKSKLGKHMYGWPLDFASDVRLTFENAMTYNAKGDDAHTMATILLNMFEEMFNPAYQKFEADHQRVIAAQKNIREPLPDSMQSEVALSLQDVMKPLPDLMLPQETLSNKSPLIQAPSSMAPREAGAKPAIVRQRKLPKPKAKQPTEIEMSHDEREKLGLSLQNLPVECMDEVLQIVRKQNSGLAAPNGDGEVELDIQALDNETMWELDKFVNLHKNAATNKIRMEELISNSTPPLHLNKPQVVEPMIQEAAVAIHKAEEDIDIGDEMPMNNYPPLEIEKDAVSSPATSGRSRSSGSSSSGSDSSSSSDSDSESSSGSDSDADGVQQSPLTGLREAPGVSGNT